MSCLVYVDRGPKYHLLAHTTLMLSHIQDSFRTHDLTISGNGEQPPLHQSVPSLSFTVLFHISLCLFFVPSSLVLVPLLLPAS